MTTECIAINGEMKAKLTLERNTGEKFDCTPYSTVARDNCEEITLIWFDNQLGQPTQFAGDLHTTEEMLRELNDYVLLFSDEIECLTHIESIKSETVLLVVAGSSASDHLLERTHQMRHVDSIFIFCHSKATHESFSENKDYNKLIGVFNTRAELALNIARSTELIDKQSAIFALYNTDKQKSTRNLSRESGSFIFLRLIKQVLHRMLLNQQAVESSKKEMLEKCRLYYRGNKKALEDIDRFEHEYTSDQAIVWYTADSFLYRLINKALRTEDVDALYTYRFYIVDLCNCLAEKSKTLYDFASNISLYRGVKMSQNERQRLHESVGHLISVNGFFSTSRDLKVSETYAGVGSTNKSAHFESVIFDIYVDLEKHPETVVADIRDISEFQDEDEVLFDIGTVFKIESMKYNEQRCYWQCRILSSNEGHAIAKDYLSLKETEFNESNDIEKTFGDLLFDMGEWLKSLKFFQKLAENRPNDPYILFGIGRSHCKCVKLVEALSNFTTAYDLCTDLDGQHMTLAANIRSYMCRVHEDRGNYDEALLYGKEAIELYQKAGEDTNRLGIAETLISIGNVHYHQGHDDASLVYFQRAYSLVKDTYMFNHPMVILCLNYLASVYSHKGDYEKSLECMQACLIIKEQLFPSNHPTILCLENHICKLYYKQGKYSQSLERFLRASSMNNLTENYNPRNKANTYNNIGKAMYRLGRLDEADVFYENALCMYKKLFSETSDHIDFAYTLKNMGEVQLVRRNIPSALYLLQRAHDMYERLFARDGAHRDIAKCKHLLALAHAKNDNDQEASNLFDSALQMWTNVLPKEHPDLALCHRSMAEFYMLKENMKEKAIMHFQMALYIYEKRLPTDHQDLIDIKNKLYNLEHL